MDIHIKGTKWTGFSADAESFSDLLEVSGATEVEARGPWGQAIKADAKRQVAEFAEAYRNKITHATAGKLAEYRIKEEIARDPTSASEAELDLLSREAIARGTDRDGLLDQISGQTIAYRQIALLIGALEAEVGAAINAIPADADNIEDKINTVLGAAKGQAETAFNEALALIKGGS
jgi:hypothetical protein